MSRYSNSKMEEEDQDTQSSQVEVDHDAQRREDDLRYPHRPKNHGQTLPFRTLYQDLFNPLIENRNRPAEQRNLRKLGTKQVNSRTAHEARRDIIESYISRWRRLVGDDFYPAMRLILPDKDRDRAMYGLKEKALAKYFIKILKIDKNSEDGRHLSEWKKEGKSAGDFPARAYDVLSRRPFRVEPGNMTIEEVNDSLDDLSRASTEQQQLPIIEDFYRNMNPEELKWLIRIILRQMHVGATERTFLSIWHPDGDQLFNISSSLKRVCWDLWNNQIRLEKEEDRGLVLGDCIQPQLAMFVPKNKKLDTYVKLLGVTEEDPEFWIEEKLDGERMQLHTWIQRTKVKNQEPDKKPDDYEYEAEPPYRVFKFWSRKAKNYTYLYGEFLDGPNEKCGFTRHLENAFEEGVDSLILDGEMITWDPETDKMVPFGTLKTAAMEAQRNPYSDAPHPLYRVFDILYLNGKDLIRYDLRTRRQALERVLKPVEHRIEILTYSIGRNWDDIERALRKVVAEASEGLVVKNPRSRYRLNDRNNDWIKVKPEYMEEFGESLDCLVIGGNYGSGKRGGGLSSFLCGLRVDDKRGQPPQQKFLSFFKVGGGFTANDYATIRHATDGKWIPWDRNKPPTEYIELGGGVQYQRERPDVWIKPEDSVVLQVKAASVSPSDEFAANLTLRFARFQRWRSDKDWKTSLSYQDMLEVKHAAEIERENKQTQMKAEQRKKHQRIDLRKKPLQIVGYTQRSTTQSEANHDESQPTKVFRGLTMYVMTESTAPKKSKLELEELIKTHGGRIIQTADPKPDLEGNPPPAVVCIVSKRSVKVASLMKRDDVVMLKPTWVFDCIAQARTDAAFGLSEILLRPELDRHVFFAPEDRTGIYKEEVDQYGDSFARDTTVEELRKCMQKMKKVTTDGYIDDRLLDLVGETPGWLFKGTKIYFAELVSTVNHKEHIRLEQARNIALFAGAKVMENFDDIGITHVVVAADDQDQLRGIRRKLSHRQRLPRVVMLSWIEDCWKEKTKLDEERYVPP